MRHTAILLMALALITASCVHDKAIKGEIPTFNLELNTTAKETSPLRVKDFALSRLSDDSDSAFFKKASIIDVFGDTAVLLENAPALSRLIIYNIRDGQYLGEVNHRGQGPGEYRMILGAFVNDTDGSVLVPNFDTPSVYKYSLSTDTLVTTIERDMVMSMIEPIGGVKSAINVAAPSFDGLKIYQYDGDYKLMDSININGFRGGNFNMLWSNAGTKGVFMVADTLYTLIPGALQPIAILQRGDYALTPEEDEKVTMKAMSGSNEIELLKPYILVRNVQYTDGKMLITTMHDGYKYSDIYDMDDGRLLYRSLYDNLSIPSNIVIERNDGKTIRVQSLFAKDGNWYGLIDEESMAEIDSPAGSEANYAIVRFSI